MDEEALANVAQQQPPQAQPEAPAQPEGRQASPREQKMFDTMARQALLMLTSESGAEALMALAQARGPAEAIANQVRDALQGVQQAAMTAGIEVTPDVVSASARACAQALAQLMAEGGAVEDPAPLAAEAVAMMEGQGQEAPPEQPAQQAQAAPMGV